MSKAECCDQSILPISLDQSCLVQDGTTNKYTYTFNPSVRFEKASIAIQSISMYYSWFNFHQALYNNTRFTLSFPTGATTQTLNITVPDGFYTIEQLNQYLQSVMIANNLYLVSGGNNVYFFEIITNANAYKVQIDTFLIPTVIGSYSYGAGGTWGSAGLPTVTRCPQITIAANGFRDIIGFNAGTYPSVATAQYSKVSDYTPQVTPVSAIKVLCSALNNKYTSPNTFLGSFNVGQSTFGQIIYISPNEFSFIRMQDQSLSNMTITFVDQNNNALPINDTSLIISLLVKS